MITTDGRDRILAYFSGQTPQIGGALALGVGETAAALSDDSLVLEVVRVPVTSISSDSVNGRIVFKGMVAPGVISNIYEAGLFSEIIPDAKSKTLNLVGLPGWTNSTLTATNARANPQALKVDFIASGTTTAELTGLAEDLSTFLDTDDVVIGFYATANVSSLRIRMGTDSSNYFEYLISTPAVGYRVARFARSDAAVTGSPDWESIEYVAVRPSGTAGGAGSVYFDGIRIEAVDESTLVARVVLGVPMATDPDIYTEIEYSLELDFT